MTTEQTVAIPPHIWEQDHDLWTAWAATRNVGRLSVLQQYKRVVTLFYGFVEKPIEQVTEDDLEQYEAQLYRSGKNVATVQAYLRIIKSYWRHAHACETRGAVL